jgi:hypothetical protein
MRTTRAERRRGAALIHAIVIAVMIAGMCMALLFVNLGTSKVRVQGRSEQRSFYAAEAGLSDAYVQLTAGLLDLEAGEPIQLGDPDLPVPFGTSTYWVALEPIDSRSWSLTSTGSDGRTSSSLQVVVSEAATGLFQYAAFGDEGVVLDSNAFIDSYDSALGFYEDQLESGSDWVNENGHVGSNADIVLSSNTQIHGDATPGPGHVVEDDAPGAYISGSTEPADEEFELIEIVPPPTVTSGAHPAGASLVVGPGDYHYESILMSGGTTLTIVGPCSLVVDDLMLKSNSKLLFDTSAGQVDLYGTGNFQLLSNSEVVTQSNSALDVTMLLSGNNMDKTPPDKVTLSSNSQFVGAIYAPKAEVSLGSNFNIYGSVMCGYLDLSSNGEIHYDEALKYDGFGSTDEYEAVLWRPVALD